MYINFFLILSLAVFIFLPGVVWAQDTHEQTPCRFKHDICTFEQAVAEVHPEDKACFEKGPVWIQLSYIDCSPNLSSAWMYYYKNDVLGGSEPDVAMGLLKYRALSRSYEDNMALLSLVQKYNIDMRTIEPMYREAIEWAQAEKNKTAQELYDKAQQIKASDTDHPESLKDNFYNTYLLLAAEKKHNKANKEISDSIEIQED